MSLGMKTMGAAAFLMSATNVVVKAGLWAGVLAVAGGAFAPRMTEALTRDTALLSVLQIPARMGMEIAANDGAIEARSVIKSICDKEVKTPADLKKPETAFCNALVVK